MSSVRFLSSCLGVSVLNLNLGGSGDFLETNHPGGVDPLQLKGCNSPDDLTSEDKLANIFESWIQEHGKEYKNSEEKLHRFEIFKDNIKDIDYQGCWLGLSKFADLTFEEFTKNHLISLAEVRKRIMEKEAKEAEEIRSLKRKIQEVRIEKSKYTILEAQVNPT